MNPPGVAMWHRTRPAAFVDDGQRVLVLRLGDPAPARPLLIEGVAAIVWRSLSTPATSLALADELTRRYPADRGATVNDVEELLGALRAASLVEVTDP